VGATEHLNVMNHAQRSEQDDDAGHN